MFAELDRVGATRMTPASSRRTPGPQRERNCAHGGAEDSRVKDGAGVLRYINAGGYGSRRSPGRHCPCMTKAYPSSRTELFRQHQKLARAGDPGPVAVKVGHQPFQVIAVHRPVQRGLVGELVGRLMQRGIAEAPEPPGLFDAERFCRVGKMLLAIPPVEGCPFGGIGDAGANDEIRCWHWLPPYCLFSLPSFRGSPPG